MQFSDKIIFSVITIQKVFVSFLINVLVTFTDGKDCASRILDSFCCELVQLFWEIAF